MTFLEVLVIIAAISIVVSVFGVSIYKMIKGESSECNTCSHKRSIDKILKNVRKELDQCNCNNNHSN